MQKIALFNLLGVGLNINQIAALESISDFCYASFVGMSLLCKGHNALIIIVLWLALANNWVGPSNQL